MHLKEIILSVVSDYNFFLFNVSSTSQENALKFIAVA